MNFIETLSNHTSLNICQNFNSHLTRDSFDCTIEDDMRGEHLAILNQTKIDSIKLKGKYSPQDVIILTDFDMTLSKPYEIRDDKIVSGDSIFSAVYKSSCSAKAQNTYKKDVKIFLNRIKDPQLSENQIIQLEHEM